MMQFGYGSGRAAASEETRKNFKIRASELMKAEKQQYTQ